MKKYKVIAFDLDGTLTNPEKGQLTGFEYALKRHGISYPSREWLKRYIGPPIHDLWQEDFGLSLGKVCEMIDTYREYYNVYGFRENDMYDGIPEVLDALKQKGYNPINQLVGYILSEDPTYITTFNNARCLIRHIDRDELLQVLVKSYLAD